MIDTKKLDELKHSGLWSVGKDKIAARAMCIVYTGADALFALNYITDMSFPGSLDLRGTMLPEGSPADALTKPEFMQRVKNET